MNLIRTMIPTGNTITAGTVVAVTGSSGGVGRASAVEFGRYGATVALLARGEAGLQGAAKEVERAGGRALIVPTDVADPTRSPQPSHASRTRSAPSTSG